MWAPYIFLGVGIFTNNFPLEDLQHEERRRRQHPFIRSYRHPRPALYLGLFAILSSQKVVELKIEFEIAFTIVTQVPFLASLTRRCATSHSRASHPCMQGTRPSVNLATHPLRSTPPAACPFSQANPAHRGTLISERNLPCSNRDPSKAKKKTWSPLLDLLMHGSPLSHHRHQCLHSTMRLRLFRLVQRS